MHFFPKYGTNSSSQSFELFKYLIYKATTKVLEKISHNIPMVEIHSSVKVLEVCTVAPPPGSAVPTSLPLTFFDILWFRFPPVQRLFFYKTPAPFTVVVSNLKRSLPVVLQHYLPIAGAIVWPENHAKPAVETTAGDGVLLTVAESDVVFHHLVDDQLREAAEFHPLVPELPATEDRAAVLAVQVTSFGNAGFCIGITSHHAILDGRSSISFVKSWARVCKKFVGSDGGGEWSESVFAEGETMPFYNRSVVADPAGLEGIYLRDWLASGGPNNRSLKFWPTNFRPNLFRGTFKLNSEHIKKLKQSILKHGNPVQPPVHISTFTVAMAYTWVCSAVADSSSPDGEMVFGMSVDARRWLDPPLPETYFGNCVVGRSAAVERTKLVGKNGLIAAVEAISKTIKSLEENGALDGAEKWVQLLTQTMEKSVKLLSTAGSPRFEVYGVDFGWGRPEKVEVVSIDGTGAVCVSEGRDEGGVELGWVAERGVLENFAAAFAKGLEQL